MARNEFVTWMQTDPHAQSNSTIWSDKFQEILSRLGAVQNDTWDSAMYSRCARCHDPQAESKRSTFVPIASIQPRGIGCESCHGPAGNWLAKHYERDVRRDLLAALGMNETRNLLVRSQVCASCHVGSAENDMNHDMIAAGHPALYFEVASYHDRLPKHWPAAAERLRVPEFQASLWAAGQLATADAALRLLGGRAERAARRQEEPESGAAYDPWPEFSEYSCLSCHRRLHTSEDTRRLRLSEGQLNSNGQPAWSPWFATLPLAPGRATTREAPAAFLSAWENLRGPMQQVSPANTKQIFDLTELARARLNASEFQFTDSRSHSLLASFSIRDLTKAIGIAAPRAENWESVCQLFLALQAAQRGYDDALRQAVARGVVSPSQQQADSIAMASIRSDLETMRVSLAFADNSDVPRAMSGPAMTSESNTSETLPSQDRTMTLDKIRQLAVRLAEQIDAHCARLETQVHR